MLVALFPGLTALVAIYGLAFDPQHVEQQVHRLSAILPPEGAKMIGSELHNLITNSQTSLSLGAVVALLFAVWKRIARHERPYQRAQHRL